MPQGRSLDRVTVGDKSTIRLDLDNVEGESGNDQVALGGDGITTQYRNQSDPAGFYTVGAPL